MHSELSQALPNLALFSPLAGILSQILNFGLPAPIDIQVTGPIGEMDHNQQIAQQIAKDLSAVPGAVDVHVQQITDAPRIMVNTNRTLALQNGLTEQAVANSLSISLNGSGTATTN